VNVRLPEPAINTPVTLDVAGWRSPVATRVEELDDTVVVADPTLAHGDHDPSLGSTVRVSWQGDRGPTEMPAVLVAKELRTVPVWRLEPDGPIVVTQRRHHVRVAALLPVALHPTSGAPDGHLVDLSEGGMKLVCPAPSPVAVGDRFGVSFDVDGTPVDVQVAVVRLEPHDDHVCACCRFIDTAPQQADIIRRFVFDRQVRERRLRNGR